MPGRPFLKDAPGMLYKVSAHKYNEIKFQQKGW